MKITEDLNLLQLYNPDFCEQEPSAHKKQELNRGISIKDEKRGSQHLQLQTDEACGISGREDEPIKKNKAKTSLKNIRRRSSIALNTSIHKLFGDKTRYHLYHGMIR